jgi:hypothetical protein
VARALCSLLTSASMPYPPAQEAKNPRRDMPIGLLLPLVICTVLYIGVSALLTYLVPYNQLNVPDPVVQGIRVSGQQWATFLVELGALALASVMLVMLLGQSRVFYAMSRDGLLWPWAAKVHPRFKTPYISSLVVGFVVAILAMLLPLNVLDEMTSVGTLRGRCLHADCLLADGLRFHRRLFLSCFLRRLFLGTFSLHSQLLFSRLLHRRHLVTASSLRLRLLLLSFLFSSHRRSLPPAHVRHETE